MSEPYVHGYQSRENQRLGDQTGALVDLLHSDTTYPAGTMVLEAGCGVGAQTVTLAQRSPGTRFISVDVSAQSVAEAKRHLTSLPRLKSWDSRLFVRRPVGFAFRRVPYFGMSLHAL